ncbi:MAG: hypothetical protein QM696_09675 [Steroidobacteraceae bacterium]
MAERPRRRPRMTGWYDPAVMAQSASMMFMANIFGRHSDTRLIEALGSQPQGSFDYSGRSGDFWIDYVADLGDGWNPTCAIAAAVAQDGPLDTRRGEVLVFGGDEVYPYPTRDAYAQRTEAPYAAAFAGVAPRPDVFAIPGNHDWFDSLVAFSRTFCRSERGFAGCATRQTRSYFALHLPRDWWLMGVDLQLGADFDEPQIRYFQGVAAQMSAQANVILCVPEPHWIYESSYSWYQSYGARTLDQFASQILRHPVRLLLTGDLHLYMRHANAEGVQKVVCGGGGAFLHPTHKPDVSRLNDGFTQQAAYPDAAQSARLAWKNLGFPWRNPRGCVLPGAVYALSAWFASSRLNLADIDTFPRALASALRVAVRDPVPGLWLMAVIAAIVFFTDTHSRPYRWIGGGLHAVAHLTAALALAWLSVRFTVDVLGMDYGQPLQMLLSGALTFLGGALAGGFIIGLYLLVSINVFGRHNNEAFSSLRIQDYKQWLRLRIGADGVLTAWAIAIDRVPRRWREEADGRCVADDPRATSPRVVDAFSVRPRT